MITQIPSLQIIYPSTLSSFSVLGLVTPTQLNCIDMYLLNAHVYSYHVGLKVLS